MGLGVSRWVLHKLQSISNVEKVIIHGNVLIVICRIADAVLSARRRGHMRERDEVEVTLVDPDLRGGILGRL